MTGLKYELKGCTRLAVIHLTPLDPSVLPAEQRSLTIKFHDFENIPDVIVLKYYSITVRFYLMLVQYSRTRTS